MRMDRFTDFRETFMTYQKANEGLEKLLSIKKPPPSAAKDQPKP